MLPHVLPRTPLHDRKLCLGLSIKYSIQDFWDLMKTCLFEKNDGVTRQDFSLYFSMLVWKD